MKFIMNTSFGLLVLCSFVWSIPVDTVKPVPVVTDPKVNDTTTEIKQEPSVTPTRVPESSTQIPPLNRSDAPETPVEPPAKPAQHGPEQTPSEKPVPEKPGHEKLQENDKSSASSHIQMYSLVISSVVVVLFSAI